MNKNFEQILRLCQKCNLEELNFYKQVQLNSNNKIFRKKGENQLYIMVTTWYPMKAAEKVGKKFLESLKVPLDKAILKRVLSASSMKKEGIKGTVIYEVKPGKVAEANLEVSKRILNFSGIEGFRGEIEILSTAAEALPLIGLEMPNA